MTQEIITITVEAGQMTARRKSRMARPRPAPISGNFLVPNRIMAITITNSKCGTLKKSNMIRPPSERFRGMSVPRHPLKQFHSEIALAAAEADVLRKGIRAM